MFDDMPVNAVGLGPGFGPSQEEFQQAQERGLRMWALEQAIKTTTATDSLSVIGIAKRYIDYVNGEEQQ